MDEMWVFVMQFIAVRGRSGVGAIESIVRTPGLRDCVMNREAGIDKDTYTYRK